MDTEHFIPKELVVGFLKTFVASLIFGFYVVVCQ